MRRYLRDVLIVSGGMCVLAILACDSGKSFVNSGARARAKRLAQNEAIEAEKAAGEKATTGEKEKTLEERKAATTSFAPKAPVLPPAECSDPGTHATSFDELSLAYDGESEFTRNHLTVTAAELIGERICIRGWILDVSVKGSRGSKFLLVRHQGKCCFGGGAPPSDNIEVTMDPGGYVSYTDQPIQVEGILSLRPYTGEDGRIWGVYHLQASSAKP